MNLRVGGNPTPEEVAAVVAALARAGTPADGRAQDGYERWRRARHSLLAESGGDRGAAARDGR